MASTSPQTPLTLPFQWKQGEHLAAVGRTGTGKSTLIQRLILNRRDSVVIQTKKDPLKWDGKLVSKAEDVTPPINGGPPTRYILRPQFDSPTIQAREIRACLNKTFKENGWCVCIDELFYVYDYLKIKVEIDRNMTQGRSEGISMVCGLQRPVAVTRQAVAQSSHIIAFQQDGRDALELAKAVGIGKDVQERLAKLGTHEFMWYSIRDSAYWCGKLDPRKNVLIGAYGKGKGTPVESLSQQR